MNKIISSLLCLLFSGWSASCLNQAELPPDPVSPAPTQSDNPILLQPVWNAYYKLPQDWDINLDHPNLARTEDPITHDQINLTLGYGEILIPAGQPNSDADQLIALHKEVDAFRQIMAPCQVLEDQGTGQNCAMPSEVFETKLAGYNTVVFRYYGNWMNRQQELDEIFVDQNNIFIRLTLQGSLAKYQKTLEDVLKTAIWKHEIPSSAPEQESGEMGL